MSSPLVFVPTTTYNYGEFVKQDIESILSQDFPVGKILCEAGFTDLQVLSAAESRVAAWGSIHLDTEPDGSVYKPDSLYMEATR
jgi:hypothetical protein